MHPQDIAQDAQHLALNVPWVVGSDVGSSDREKGTACLPIRFLEDEFRFWLWQRVMPVEKSMEKTACMRSRWDDCLQLQEFESTDAM